MLEWRTTLALIKDISVFRNWSDGLNFKENPIVGSRFPPQYVLAYLDGTYYAYYTTSYKERIIIPKNLNW